MILTNNHKCERKHIDLTFTDALTNIYTKSCFYGRDDKEYVNEDI